MVNEDGKKLLLLSAYFNQLCNNFNFLKKVVIFELTMSKFIQQFDSCSSNNNCHGKISNSINCTQVAKCFVCHVQEKLSSSSQSVMTWELGRAFSRLESQLARYIVNCRLQRHQRTTSGTLYVYRAQREKLNTAPHSAECLPRHFPYPPSLLFN
jgi:hypothetical protein